MVLRLEKNQIHYLLLVCVMKEKTAILCMIETNNLYPRIKLLIFTHILTLHLHRRLIVTFTSDTVNTRICTIKIRTSTLKTRISTTEIRASRTKINIFIFIQP